MSKIRVLHLELDGYLGGIESFLFNLYSQIDREQIQFDFITRADDPAMGNELISLGAHIFKVSSYKNPIKYMNDLDKIVRNGNYDVVHVHKNSAANILPFLVTHKYKNIRVFVHSHNTQPSTGTISKILHHMNKRILWNCAEQHFACSQVAGEWLYGKRKEFVVLKNGILTNRYLFDAKTRKQKREELGIEDDVFVLGNVGRFTEQKNQKRLIDVFCQIQKIRSNSVLLLVGDGDLRKTNQQYVREIGAENIIFLGVRRDIPELMMAMDVFVIPSIYEGLPIVAVEAQATGLTMFVADSVSPETKIIDRFLWFSLDNNNESISNLILKSAANFEERKKYCGVVMQAGFDMKLTAIKLQNSYIYSKC